MATDPDPIPPLTPHPDLALSLEAARHGDSGAFASLSEPHRRELLTHCYRMLGSPQDAEDLVQETFARAWRRLETYQGRASFRAWLYKIATNACLDYLERRPRRSLPQHKNAPIDGSGPLPPPVGEPIWIEPFPEELLAPSEANPEARYEAHESISLAFLVALQVLPPRQRCVLILGDVLDWTAAEIADMLGVTISAVNSLLHHARTTLKQRYTTRKREEPRSTEADQKTKSLLERYLKAWESADIDEIVSLLTEDASFPMPPLPAWFQGHTAIRALISGTILAGEAQGRWRLLPVKANGQPAFAFYQYNPSTQTYQAFAIQVLRIEANLVDEAVTFGYPALFPFFNLPVELDRVGAKEVKMAESVYKIIELVGTSSESWEKAAAAAVATAAKSLRDLRIAEVVELDMQLEDDKIVAYRVKVKVSFKYHQESD